MLTNNRGRLTPKQNKAILGLIEKSVLETARELHIPERTLYRWMKQSLFKSILQEERAAKYYRDSARLVQLRPAGISVLAKLLLDPNSPPTIRIRAAESVLDQTRETFELQELESRLTNLEQDDEAEEDKRK